MSMNTRYIINKTPTRPGEYDVYWIVDSQLFNGVPLTSACFSGPFSKQNAADYLTFLTQKNAPVGDEFLDEMTLLGRLEMFIARNREEHAERCNECGALVSRAHDALVSRAHDESCSLHPDNVQP